MSTNSKISYRGMKLLAKKLGLIGETGPESTIIYYHQLTQRVQQQTGNFPHINIESLSFFDVLNYMDQHDYEGLTEYLLRGINSLAAAGADFAALTGITPHIVIDQLQQQSPIPMVSMLDTTRDVLHHHGMKKVLLLGTEQTMNAGFAEKYLGQNGFDVTLPSLEERHYIGQKIENELELGKVVPTTQHKLIDIVNRIAQTKQLDAVILGCTELPLAFNGISLAIPQIDVMEHHIERLSALLTIN